jgi:predicted nucleic acid-binding protein
VIVLDTNVLSELMRPAPDARVMAWLLAQPASDLHTTSITQAEILFGLQLLPAGRRRTALQRSADEMFGQDFAGRVLEFGSDAAPAYARLAADRRRSGRPIAHHDAQIAAIAKIRGAVLATRNVADFRGCGVEIVDPWR